tara:strand:- start:62 stop:220 length:159 start_codon:yes stop_codon:yes gene_type:complete
MNGKENKSSESFYGDKLCGGLPRESEANPTPSKARKAFVFSSTKNEKKSMMG